MKSSHVKEILVPKRSLLVDLKFMDSESVRAFFQQCLPRLPTSLQSAFVAHRATGRERRQGRFIDGSRSI